MFHIQSYLLIVLSVSFLSGEEIEKKVACNTKTIILECIRGHLLTIVSANYGRTDVSVCAASKGGNKTDCINSMSLQVAKENCEGKPTCTLKAVNNKYGDPCVGTNKYLEVEYICGPAPPCNITDFQCDDGKCISKKLLCDGIEDCSDKEDERGCNYRLVRTCQGRSFDLKCFQDEVINVIYGYYGRKDNTMCKIENVAPCHSKSADQKMKNRCNGKRSCEIPLNNDEYGDPCRGYHKYGEVKYYCEPIQVTNKTANV